jgi:hypothetical protein
MAANCRLARAFAVNLCAFGGPLRASEIDRLRGQAEGQSWQESKDVPSAYLTKKYLFDKKKTNK